MKRKFCWIYYDTAMDQIVRVKKPRRRVLDPRMTVYSTDSTGALMDFYTVPVSEFRKRFEYLGGLNT